MTVVLVNRYFFPDHSATSQLLTDLAMFLAGRGQSVILITSRHRYDDPRADLPARESVGGVDIHRVWTSRFGRGFLPGRALDYLTFYAMAGGRLMRVVKRGDVLVAKTDPPMISVVAGIVCRRRKALLVNWLQDLFPEVAGVHAGRGLPAWVLSALRALRNRTLRQAVCNVVPGDLMAARLRGEGVTAERIRVIHNWADGTAVRPVSHEANVLRREWGLEGKFVVGYSGNLGRAHELDTVLGVAERLRTNAEVRFLFIGGGALYESLRQRTASRGLTNVDFRHYQPRCRLSESLSLADAHLVILRPEMEGLIVPSKFYGVAAVGRPTLFVGDRDGEIAGVIRDADAGLTVPLGDAEGLVAAIDELRCNPAVARSMGRNARRLLLERFSAERGLQEWERVLEEAALQA